MGPAGDGHLLALCHMDPVWPLGTLARMPLVERDGTLRGPGVFDMKGGVMASLAALEAPRDLPRRPLVLLYTTGEEAGSVASRPLIEETARGARAALVPEPGLPPHGARKSSRSGPARFVVGVTGRPAHSGAKPRAGVSAVEELCRRRLRLHAITGHDRGTTVNAGVVQGLTRPPMARSPAVEPLLEEARRVAGRLGFALPEAHTGGSSDGNLTAAAGVPTLGGLDAAGDGARARDEHIVASAIPRRVALLAHLLLSL